MKILVSITTTNKNYSKNIKDLKRLKVKEIALFLTLFATKNIRKKLYKELLKNNINSIPVVHLRNDMKIDEIEYLIKTFKTKMFNTHPKGYHEIKDKKILEKYKNKLYIENIETNMTEKEVNDYAGICLDVSHLHDTYLKKSDNYKETIELLKKHKIGFAHASAVKKEPYLSKYSKKLENVDHFFEHISEFNYLKKYKKYLPKIIAFEVNNSIEDQLKAKKYIEKLLK